MEPEALRHDGGITSLCTSDIASHQILPVRQVRALVAAISGRAASATNQFFWPFGLAVLI
jgi:hypothetical protein